MSSSDAQSRSWLFFLNRIYRYTYRYTYTALAPTLNEPRLSVNPILQYLYADAKTERKVTARTALWQSQGGHSQQKQLNEEVRNSAEKRLL